MTLLDLLADDLLVQLGTAPDGVPRRVLLWLDPQAQFSRLVAQLEPALLAREAQLLRYAPEAGTGQLQLKLALLRLEAEPGARAVVYLPGFDCEALEPRADGCAPTLWSVYEQRFKGAVWGRGERREVGTVPEPPTLLGWLRRHRIKVVDQQTARKLAAGGADSLLARFAERTQGRAPADWPQPLRLSDVEAALAGDPRDALRGLLAAPGNEVRRWALERPTVLARIEAEYGLRPPSEDADPEALADRFAIDLALAEAWEAFGSPEDFPFLARLPQRPEHRRRQAAFLRDDVLGHAELGPRLRQRVRKLEPSYPLADWARDRHGQPGALPLLAQIRWRHLLGRLDAAGGEGWKAALELLRSEREAIRVAATANWSRLDEDTAWPVLGALLDLDEQAGAVPVELEGAKTAGEMIRRYAERWWRLDACHLELLAGARRAGLETARRIGDRVYFEAVARLADRFAALVEREGHWPPTGTTAVDSLRSALWGEGSGRRAVIVTDACRWDLASALAEALGPAACSLSPVAATLPTTTPFGMTALLPLADTPLEVDFAAGQPSIRQGSTANLATRDGRRAFLRAALVDDAGKPRVDFVDLEALLKGADVPKDPFVVVLDNALDEQGHKGTEQLPSVAMDHVRSLKRAVERLHGAGIETVHVVTDHGFLLLPPEAVEELGTPAVLPGQAYHKGQRWAALKPDAPTAEVLRLPLPLAPGAAVLGFPRGVRTLMKAEPYLHGGISLQECIIPHLVSRRVAPKPKLGLDLQVSTPQLSGGTVPVILRPRAAGEQLSLFGVEPLTARVWLETVPEEGGAARTVAGPIEVQVRADAEELRPPLYLDEGRELGAGQRLRLRAVDAETGQDLGSLELTLLVDWD